LISARFTGMSPTSRIRCLRTFTCKKKPLELLSALLPVISAVTAILVLTAPAPVCSNPTGAEETSVSAFGDFEVLDRINLGGAGSWNYLTADSQARNLYIARCDRVMVIDLDERKLKAEIGGMLGVRAVALAPEFNKGFITCASENAVRVFDLKTMNAAGRINVVKSPDNIVYDPFSRKVFAFSRAAPTAAVIDAATARSAGQIRLGGVGIAGIPDGSGKLYVNLADRGEIAVIDTLSQKLTARWPLAPGARPAGLALDLTHKRLFSACRNNLMVILNAESGAQIKTVPIGAGVDATVFDAGSQNLFAANGEDGTLTVIHESDPASFAAVQNLPTGRGARTMAFDQKKQEIWLVTAALPEASEAGGSESFIPGSFAALIVGKHVPVDPGIPFSRRHAACLPRAGSSPRAAP
jgi:DNA-binding beta-propeller fold protein YncE